jgi:hypothetical protein
MQSSNTILDVNEAYVYRNKGGVQGVEGGLHAIQTCNRGVYACKYGIELNSEAIQLSEYFATAHGGR